MHITALDMIKKAAEDNSIPPKKKTLSNTTATIGGTVAGGALGATVLSSPGSNTKSKLLTSGIVGAVGGLAGYGVNSGQ